MYFNESTDEIALKAKSKNLTQSLKVKVEIVTVESFGMYFNASTIMLER